MCKDPLRKVNSILVLCETYCSDGETPARYNFRNLANTIMVDAKSDDPWFGIE
jgi:glutamine synthetase